MDAEALHKQMISRDIHDVWISSCEIISNSQDRCAIVPLIKYLPEIQEKTKGLDMGGMFAPNQRFVDFAIRIIEFHKEDGLCPCNLYLEHGVDPEKEEEKDNVFIIATVKKDHKWVEHYMVGCKRCNEKYKVIEGDWHFRWWEWSRNFP